MNVSPAATNPIRSRNDAAVWQLCNAGQGKTALVVGAVAGHPDGMGERANAL
jgi:hypothetical protein